MAPLIKVTQNMFQEVERILHYRFHDKERERSNRAAGLVQAAKGTTRRCPLRHDMIAYSGPPNDKVRCFVCLRCNAAASEPEIIDRGFDFDFVPNWIVEEILDLDLQRQGDLGNPVTFSGMGGVL